MAEEPFRFEGPIYVLCEGPADVRLVTRLIEARILKALGEFREGIKNSRATSRLMRAARLAQAESPLIIGDNDVTCGQRWQNACDAAREDCRNPRESGRTCPTVHRPPASSWCRRQTPTGRLRPFSSEPSSGLIPVWRPVYSNWMSAKRQIARRGTPSSGPKCSFRPPWRSSVATIRAPVPPTSGRRRTIRFRPAVLCSMSSHSFFDARQRSSISSQPQRRTRPSAGYFSRMVMLGRSAGAASNQRAVTVLVSV